MPFYKFLKVWFYPPGIFILMFISLTIYLWHCSRQSKDKKLSKTLGFGAIACVVFATLTYMLSVEAVAQRFLHSVEYKVARQYTSADAILVLGGDSPARTITAIRLYNKYKVDVIPSGYRGEAERIQKVMVGAKVPKEKFILEPKATNTKDHAKYILPIALERGYKKVYVVTDAYHMPRSMMILERPFKEKGIEVVPYPCGYMTPREYRSMRDSEWLPDIRNLEMSTIAWHEYLGMLELWLFGSL